MKLKLTLSGKATQAVVRSVLTGPNCASRGDGLKQFLSVTEQVDLANIAKYFENGPDTFLVWYAVSTGKDHLEDLDIVKAYCLYHLQMVQVAQVIYCERGQDDDYFRPLRERGFVIKPKDILSYCFSCCGKAARVIKRNGKLGEVAIGDKVIKGVVIPSRLKSDWVAIHFATAIADLTEKEAADLTRLQFDNPWLVEISKMVQTIDYSNFCGGNLTSYVQTKIHP